MEGYAIHTIKGDMSKPLPYNPLRMKEEEYARSVKNWNGIQFSHSLEEQIGGQLQAGFRLTHLYEDRDREGQGLIREFMPLDPNYFGEHLVKN